MEFWKEPISSSRIERWKRAEKHDSRTEKKEIHPMNPKIAALVPMRHHSQRVPGKNYRLIAGKPLYHYVIENLYQVPAVSQIVVDTDSEEIMAGLAKGFPEVRVIDRPAALRGDDLSMNEILIHDVNQLPEEHFLQTHSTNPLVTPQTISRAIETYFDKQSEYDSLFAVTRIQVRLWDSGGKPINHDPAVLLQTQDLPPVYEENSCFYIFSKTDMIARRNRLGKRPQMFEISRDEAWDIDEEIDFQIVELLLQRRKARINSSGNVG
jgi:CMP-N-acetylneuraminic acid synthetase